MRLGEWRPRVKRQLSPHQPELLIRLVVMWTSRLLTAKQAVLESRIAV